MVWPGFGQWDPKRRYALVTPKYARVYVGGRVAGCVLVAQIDNSVVTVLSRKAVTELRCCRGAK